METRDLSPVDFPERIRRLKDPPQHLTVAGDIEPKGARRIAFVGARRAHAESKAFATSLASACAEQGAIIVSGGALGIDTASHGGAMSVGGRTWAVLGTGKDHCFPPENEELFARISAAPGCAIFWPFESSRKAMSQNFLARNRILIALADLVVVIQAQEASGSRNAARLARESKKEVWVVPGPPWLSGFSGSFSEIAAGAKTLWSQEVFLSAIFGPPRDGEPRKKKPIVDRTPEETALLDAATTRPEHIDELCELAGLSPPSAATALLTLALEHVLVEGPPGYYRKEETK